MTAPSLFDTVASRKAELADAITAAVLPEKRKATFRDLMAQAGTDVAKLDALLLRVRARNPMEG